MTVSKVRPNHAHRLIVEGRDDKYAIIALMARHGWNWQLPDLHCPYIAEEEGAPNALEALSVAVKSHVRIGIVLDADADPGMRWQQLETRLSGTRFTLPTAMNADGTVVSDGANRFGAWLMPDNSTSGNLENFLSHLVPDNDQSWTHAVESTKIAREAKGAPFRDVDSSKANMHTWLAWRESPGLPFGTAITAAALRHDSDIAVRFALWMRRLYE